MLPLFLFLPGRQCRQPVPPLPACRPGRAVAAALDGRGGDDHPADAAAVLGELPRAGHRRPGGPRAGRDVSRRPAGHGGRAAPQHLVRRGRAAGPDHGVRGAGRRGAGGDRGGLGPGRRAGRARVGGRRGVRHRADLDHPAAAAPPAQRHAWRPWSSRTGSGRCGRSASCSATCTPAYALRRSSRPRCEKRWRTPGCAWATGSRAGPPSWTRRATRSSPRRPPTRTQRSTSSWPATGSGWWSAP